MTWTLDTSGDAQGHELGKLNLPYEFQQSHLFDSSSHISITIQVFEATLHAEGFPAGHVKHCIHL